MKRVALFLMMLVLMTGCSLLGKKPIEKLIPKSDVELTGNGYQVFRLGADVKLVTVQSPDEPDQWMIRASVPLMKVVDDPVGVMTINVNLLDDSSMKVRDGYMLTAEDLVDLIPKFNADKNVEKNIVFSASEDSRRFFSYKEVKDMMERTKSLAMNVSFLQANPEKATIAAPDATKEEPLTLNGLLTKHGVYGLLSQYEKKLKNKEKKEAKKIEDRLFQICKQVKADPTVPEALAKKFRDYIEDKEDEIEDKY